MIIFLHITSSPRLLSMLYKFPSLELFSSEVISVKKRKQNVTNDQLTNLSSLQILYFFPRILLTSQVFAYAFKTPCMRISGFDIQIRRE